MNWAVLRPRAVPGHGVGEGWWEQKQSATSLGLGLTSTGSLGQAVYMPRAFRGLCSFLQTLLNVRLRRRWSPATHLPSPFHAWAAHHRHYRLPGPGWEGRRLPAHRQLGRPEAECGGEEQAE